MSDPAAALIEAQVRDVLAAARLPSDRAGRLAATVARRVLTVLAGRYVPADRSARTVFEEEWSAWLAAGRPGRFQVSRVADRCRRTPRTIARWAAKKKQVGHLPGGDTPDRSRAQ